MIGFDKQSLQDITQNLAETATKALNAATILAEKLKALAELYITKLCSVGNRYWEQAKSSLNQQHEKTTIDPTVDSTENGSNHDQPTEEPTTPPAASSNDFSTPPITFTAQPIQNTSPSIFNTNNPLVFYQLFGHACRTDINKKNKQTSSVTNTQPNKTNTTNINIYDPYELSDVCFQGIRNLLGV